LIDKGHIFRVTISDEEFIVQDIVDAVYGFGTLMFRPSTTFEEVLKGTLVIPIDSKYVITSTRNKVTSCYGRIPAMSPRRPLLSRRRSRRRSKIRKEPSRKS
jgi:hypothetical protein